jgi:hypothetical protein
MEYRWSKLGGKKPHQQMMISELTPSLTCGSNLKRINPVPQEFPREYGVPMERARGKKITSEDDDR